MSVLYHGDAPDLKPGDYIEPCNSRDNYDDRPICRARREKDADTIEAPASIRNMSDRPRNCSKPSGGR